MIGTITPASSTSIRETPNVGPVRTATFGALPAGALVPGYPKHSSCQPKDPPRGSAPDADQKVDVRGAVEPSPPRRVMPALRSRLAGPIVRLSISNRPTSVVFVPRSPPVGALIVGKIAKRWSGPAPSTTPAATVPIP